MIDIEAWKKLINIFQTKKKKWTHVVISEENLPFIK